MTKVELGCAIRERRKSLGLSQRMLADIAGMSVNTLTALERGEGNPSLSTLMTLTDTLGMSLSVRVKTIGE